MTKLKHREPKQWPSRDAYSGVQSNHFLTFGTGSPISSGLADPIASVAPFNPGAPGYQTVLSRPESAVGQVGPVIPGAPKIIQIII